MSDDLIPARPMDILPAQASLQQLLVAALIDDRINPDKLEKLLALQIAAEARDAERQFNEALSRAQQKFPPVERTRKIVVKGRLRSKYAAYEDIAAKIKPILAAEGLFVSYGAHSENKSAIKVMIEIRHKAGHKIEREVALPLDESEYRNIVQNVGSTLTYCRRYALTMALDLVTEGVDDDAESMSPLTEEEAGELRTLMEECTLSQAATSTFLRVMDVKAFSDLTRGHMRFARSYLTVLREKLSKEASK
ncbi:MAG TPA: ERF family protein [Bryobacteraceae bacterium]|jgi:hypothetical protein